LKVSIIPRGSSALGFSQSLPLDRYLHTKEHLFDQLCVLLGGRVAEELIFGSITTGAQDDLEKVTELSYALIIHYGMSDELGPINYSERNDQGFMGKPFSDKTSELIDVQVFKVIEEAYVKTKEILKGKIEGLTAIANLLIEKEIIHHEDIQKILGEREGLTEKQIHYLKQAKTVEDEHDSEPKK